MSARDVSFRLESDAFPCDLLQLRAFQGREAIGQLFWIDIDAVHPDRNGIDVEAMAGADACLVLESEGAEIRRFHGMIAGVKDRLDPEASHRTYRLRLVPRAHRLSLVTTQDIFQDLSVPEILRAKLDLVGLDGANVDLRLASAYAPREFVVQYAESDLAFVSRLAEHLGIGFFFEHDDGFDRMVLTDHEAGFRPIEGAVARFRGRGDRRDVFSLEVETQLVPSVYMVYDYNYRMPHMDLRGSVELPSGHAGGVAEYGGHFKTPVEGEALARVRSEEHRSTQQVYGGESDVAAFRAGARLTLEEHPHLEHVGLLLVEVEHRGTQPALGGGHEDRPPYQNTFRAVGDGFTYRPPRVTPRPRIPGLLTGIIDAGPGGGSGHHARIDHEGRYMVRFLFDMAPGERPKASRPVRMAQPHAGAGYGTHFPLKPGTEVLLAFVGGDPDRPVIVGAVPNPMTPSPVVAANATHNVIRTVSGVQIHMNDGPGRRGGGA